MYRRNRPDIIARRNSRNARRANLHANMAGIGWAALVMAVITGPFIAASFVG